MTNSALTLRHLEGRNFVRMGITRIGDDGNRRFRAESRKWIFRGCPKNCAADYGDHEKCEEQNCAKTNHSFTIKQIHRIESGQEFHTLGVRDFFGSRGDMAIRFPQSVERGDESDPRQH